MDDLNRLVCSRLSTIDAIWRSDADHLQIEMSHGVAGSDVDLDACLKRPFNGSIHYVSRTRLANRDHGVHDDRLTISADINGVEYAEFCYTTAPRVIEAFGSYRARVNTDQVVATSDWSKVQEEMIERGRSIDGRDGVLRVWPVSYFDEILCQRAWGISSDEVVRRAAPACEQAYLLSGGAFLLVTSEFVRGEALNDVSKRVMSRLREGGLPI